MTPELVELFLDECFTSDPDINPGALRAVIKDTGGQGLCHEVVTELVDFLWGHGIIASYKWLDLPHPAYPNGEEWDDVHAVCVVGSTAIDFTARQFAEDPETSDYPVPYVWEL